MKKVICTCAKKLKKLSFFGSHASVAMPETEIHNRLP